MKRFLLIVLLAFGFVLFGCSDGSDEKKTDDILEPQTSDEEIILSSNWAGDSCFVKLFATYITSEQTLYYRLEMTNQRRQITSVFLRDENNTMQVVLAEASFISGVCDNPNYWSENTMVYSNRKVSISQGIFDRTKTRLSFTSTVTPSGVDEIIEFGVKRYCVGD